MTNRADVRTSHPVVDVLGPTPGRITCPPGTSVLRAMVAAGRSQLPVGRRSGGCGVCRVQVIEGEYTVGPMSARQVGADAADGVALACRLYPSTNLRIIPLGRRPATVTTDRRVS